MTQLGEPVAIGLIDEIPDPPVENTQEKDIPKPCHLKVRVKRPSGKGPWYAAGKVGGGEADDDLTGHTFCALLDEGDTPTWHGFYPKGAIEGWQNVPAEDQIAGLGDFFKYVAGHLYHGDADHPYDDEKIWILTRKCYDAGQAFANKWEADKTKYSLALQNCTTFVVRDASAACCAVPSAGFLFDNPASFGKSFAKS